MQYDGLAWTLALIALLALLVAARILFDRHWFLGWLRGCAGLAFVAAAVLVALAAWDLRSYQALPSDHPLATLSFRHVGAAALRSEGAGRQQRAQRRTDRRSLAARCPHHPVEGPGRADRPDSPATALQSLSGRFLAIEQQGQARRQELADSGRGIDLWRWLRDGQHDLLIFKPQAGRVNFLPLADQAVFSVQLGPAGLEAAPVNQAAIQALQNWR